MTPSRKEPASPLGESREARPQRRDLKRAAKAVVNGIALVLMFPLAALTAFGRWESAFQFFGQALAFAPGKPGDYLRVAYYFMTLRQASLAMRISFGSFFAHSSATVGSGVYVGAYCILGHCNLGDRTQVASHVQILSGSRQHHRGQDGRISGSDAGAFATVNIGSDCWLGASSVIMADIGARTTLGAGSVVTRAIPADVIAVGNPARILQEQQI